MDLQLGPGVEQVTIAKGDLGQARSMWLEEEGVLVLSPALTPDEAGACLANWLRALVMPTP